MAVLCVECPQYSTRLEGPPITFFLLGLIGVLQIGFVCVLYLYLYVSSNTMSPALRPTSVPSRISIHPAI